MANRSSILRQRPSGRADKVKGLLGGPHGPGSAVFEALALLSADFSISRADFRSADVANEVGATKEWQYAESNADGEIAKLTPTAADPDAITLTVTANADRAVELLGQIGYVAEQNPWAEIRFKTDDVAGVEFFFGFDDSVPASAGDILGDIDTPTFASSTDAAGIGIDTAQTLTTAAFVTKGAAAAGKTDLVATAPYGMPTVNVYVTWRVELRNDRAFLFVNGELVAERSGINTGAIVTPVFFFATRAADGAVITIDYIEAGQERVGAPLS